MSGDSEVRAIMRSNGYLLGQHLFQRKMELGRGELSTEELG